MADGHGALHFDELSKVRLLDADLSARTQEMKDECKEFVDSEMVARETDDRL